MGIAREVPTPARRLTIHLTSAEWAAIDAEAKRLGWPVRKLAASLLRGLVPMLKDQAKLRDGDLGLPEPRAGPHWKVRATRLDPDDDEVILGTVRGTFDGRVHFHFDNNATEEANTSVAYFYRHWEER